jgi:hypothetical protein
MSAESAGRKKLETAALHPCSPRYICTDIEAGRVAILDGRHELALSVVMSGGLDSFEIVDGERSTRFRRGRLYGFLAEQLSLANAGEAEILSPSGRYRLLIVSQGVVYDDAWRGLPVSVVYDS